MLLVAQLRRTVTRNSHNPPMSLVRRGRLSVLPAEELFACVCVLVHDLIVSGAVQVPRHPGPAPACADAELLAIAEVRHLPHPRAAQPPITRLGGRH